jgi:hypothetical protein
MAFFMVQSLQVQSFNGIIVVQTRRHEFGSGHSFDSGFCGARLGHFDANDRL